MINYFDAINNSGKSRSSILTQIDRAAYASDSYGSAQGLINSGSADVIDLKQFVNKTKHLAPKQAKTLLKALDKYVLHHINGSYSRNCGLGIYYPITNNFNNYLNIWKGAFPTPLILMQGQLFNSISNENYRFFSNVIRQAFKFIDDLERDFAKYSDYITNYTYDNNNNNDMLDGLIDDVGNNDDTDSDVDLDDTDEDDTDVDSDDEDEEDTNTDTDSEKDKDDTVNNDNVDNPRENDENATESIDKTIIRKLSNVKLTFNKDNDAYVNISEDIMDVLSHVLVQVMYYHLPDEKYKNGYLAYYGTDAQLEVDWEKGKVTDNFNGSWPALDGHFIPVWTKNITDNYVIYDSLIKVNGEKHNMTVVYNYDTETYSILGIQQINEKGLQGRTVNLKDGDIITTVFYFTNLVGDKQKVTESDFQTFEYKSTMKLEDKPFGNQFMAYNFVFVDATGQRIASETVSAVIDKKKNIYVDKMEDVISGKVNPAEYLEEDEEETEKEDDESEDEESSDDTE